CSSARRMSSGMLIGRRLLKVAVPGTPYPPSEKLVEGGRTRKPSGREEPRGSLSRSLNPLGALVRRCRAGDPTPSGTPLAEAVGGAVRRPHPLPFPGRKSSRFQEDCGPCGPLVGDTFDDPE